MDCAKDAFSLVEKTDQSERGQTDQQFPISILILSGLRTGKESDRLQHSAMYIDLKPQNNVSIHQGNKVNSNHSPLTSDGMFFPKLDVYFSLITDKALTQMKFIFTLHILI